VVLPIHLRRLVCSTGRHSVCSRVGSTVGLKEGSFVGAQVGSTVGLVGDTNAVGGTVGPMVGKVDVRGA